MEISRFPNKLRLFRRCRGYSQKKVARMLGLSDPSLISKWELGTRVPSIVQVFRLAGMYRTQPSDLFDEFWQHIAEEYSSPAHNDEPFISNTSMYV